MMFCCVLSLSHIMSWGLNGAGVIVLIPDLCPLTYFKHTHTSSPTFFDNSSTNMFAKLAINHFATS